MMVGHFIHLATLPLINIPPFLPVDGVIFDLAVEGEALYLPLFFFLFLFVVVVVYLARPLPSSPPPLLFFLLVAGYGIPLQSSHLFRMMMRCPLCRPYLVTLLFIWHHITYNMTYEYMILAVGEDRGM